MRPGDERDQHHDPEQPVPGSRRSARAIGTLTDRGRVAASARPNVRAQPAAVGIARKAR
jgi:hypothetical protein